MFHTIRPEMKARMQELERQNMIDRQDGTPTERRLLQITPDTGQFLALLAAGAPEGTYLEIGTSAGYSAMWTSLACEQLGRQLNTIELSPHKVKLAKETFSQAHVDGAVKIIEGDARQLLGNYDHIAFCFLDCWKDLYAEVYEAVVPKLVKGGIFVADNAVDHQDVLKDMLARAISDPRVDAMIVPIGNGELVCRKI